MMCLCVVLIVTARCCCTQFLSICWGLLHYNNYIDTAQAQYALAHDRVYYINPVTYFPYHFGTRLIV